MNKYFPLSTVVTGFVIVDDYIDCICGEKVVKLDKHNGTILEEKQIFEKPGFSRKIIYSKHQLIIYDFCMLYILEEKDFSVIRQIQLGNDLTSDICGLKVDDDFIFSCIRNGTIAVINRKTFEVRSFQIDEHSMWSIQSLENQIYVGTVDGKLIILDKETMQMKNSLVLSNKNIRGLEIEDHLIYAASQNKSLYLIDCNTQELVGQAKNLHMKMFDIVGFRNNQMITISHPCSEIKIWTKDSIELIGRYHVPLSLSGTSYLDGNQLYLTSRNIKGIGIIHI